MTDILGVTASGTTAAGSSSTTAGSLLTKDDFLRLLVTQLRNQDPLNPLDQNQFLSQTAQFSQLEGLLNINKTLTELATKSTSSGVAEAAALLGKTVKAAGQSFAFDGAAAALPFTLEGRVAPVQVQILDEQGNVLRVIGARPAATGAQTVQWDGRDSAGRPVAAGTYYYRVTAATGTGGPRAVATVGLGVLAGLEVSNGSVLYRLGSALIRPEDVIDVQI